MAIARLSVKVGKVGKASPHAAYISRIGKYADRLAHGELLEATATGNLPAWAQHDPLLFWQAADQHERSNGSTYREHEMALPRELSPSQRKALVEDWIKQEIGANHVYQYAIHNPTAADGKEQPHVHLMFSERQLDGIERDPAQFFKRYNGKHPERGGARKANTGIQPAERKAQLKAQRSRWASRVNDHLKRAGIDVQIDMRSHAEQGIDKVPEPKMLPSEWHDSEQKARIMALRISQSEQAQAQAHLNPLIPQPDLEITRLRADATWQEKLQPENIQQRFDQALKTVQLERDKTVNDLQQNIEHWNKLLDAHLNAQPKRGFWGWGHQKALMTWNTTLQRMTEGRQALEDEVREVRQLDVMTLAEAAFQQKWPELHQERERRQAEEQRIQRLKAEQVEAERKRQQVLVRKQREQERQQRKKNRDRDGWER